MTENIPYLTMNYEWFIQNHLRNNLQPFVSALFENWLNVDTSRKYYVCNFWYSVCLPFQLPTDFCNNYLQVYQVGYFCLFCQNKLCYKDTILLFWADFDTTSTAFRQDILKMQIFRFIAQIHQSDTPFEQDKTVSFFSLMNYMITQFTIENGISNLLLLHVDSFHLRNDTNNTLLS